MEDGHSSDAACIKLSRLFAAPRDLVYHLWTDPACVALWWGVSNVVNVVLEMDVRPGGRWRIDMTTPNGVTYPNGGEFLEVMENERLTYTDFPFATSPAWNGVPPGPTLCTVEFSSVAEGTMVLLTVQFSSPEDLARMTRTGFKEGLGQGFDRLGSLLVDRTASTSNDSGQGRHS